LHQGDILKDCFIEGLSSGLAPMTIGISTSLPLFSEYYRCRGLWATIRRVGLAARRAVFSSRSILFYYDLSSLTALPGDLQGFLQVERKRSSGELTSEGLEAMTSFWNPKLAHRNMKERFGKGASLRLIKSYDRLAGCGWTLQGSTIEPH
jgi:hypothetical protein